MKNPPRDDLLVIQVSLRNWQAGHPVCRFVVSMEPRVPFVCMRLFAIFALSVCCSALHAEETATEESAEASVEAPLKQLKDLGIPVTYGRLEYPHEATRAEQVEFVRLGALGNEAALPKEAFDILCELPNLRKLSLTCLSFEPEWLRPLGEKVKLRYLRIHDATSNFAGQNSLDVLEAFSELERLDLQQCDLTDDMLSGLLPLQRLEQLRLPWNKITQAGLPTLLKLKSLKQLFLAYNQVGGSLVDIQRHAARLEHLSFRYNPVYGQPVDIEQLRQLLALPRHTWDVTYRTSARLADIAELLPGPVTRIKTEHDGTSFSGIDRVGAEFTLRLARRLSDVDLSDIGRMGELRHLELSWSPYGAKYLNISDQGLAQLARLEQLETLTLDTAHRLTGTSLRALASMPDLHTVSLVEVQLSADDLQWMRSTPHLVELSLARGQLDGEALADLAAAPALRKLTLNSISIKPPSRAVEIDHVRDLSIRSPTLTIAEGALIGRFTALTSLRVAGPVTDAHVSQWAPLKRLERLAFEQIEQTGKPAKRGHVTVGGLQHLRAVETDLFVRGAGTGDAQAMADQFGWRFYGCSSGCCDTVPAPAVEISTRDIQGERPRPSEVNDAAGAVRLSGPIDLDRLVLRQAELSESPLEQLFITDCRINTLRLEGWAAKEIRFWGDCRIGRIESDVIPPDGESVWSYRYYDAARELIVPASRHLTALTVHDSQRLSSLKLMGHYPKLMKLNLQNVGGLRYLAAPYSGDAPLLDLSSSGDQLAALPKLRLLKLPGTAFCSASQDAMSEISLPPSLREVDLRATDIGGKDLLQLSSIPGLHIVRIAECRDVSEHAKAAFRRARPDVELDDTTLHRP